LRRLTPAMPATFIGTVRNFVREAMMMKRGESSHGYREGRFGPASGGP
jgi:hypothetical protein